MLSIECLSLCLHNTRGPFAVRSDHYAAYTDEQQLSCIELCYTVSRLSHCPKCMLGSKNECCEDLMVGGKIFYGYLRF